jgi:hypothetical protein
MHAATSFSTPESVISRDSDTTSLSKAPHEAFAMASKPASDSSGSLGMINVSKCGRGSLANPLMRTSLLRSKLCPTRTSRISNERNPVWSFKNRRGPDLWTRWGTWFAAHENVSGVCDGSLCVRVCARVRVREGGYDGYGGWVRDRAPTW